MNGLSQQEKEEAFALRRALEKVRIGQPVDDELGKPAFRIVDRLLDVAVRGDERGFLEASSTVGRIAVTVCGRCGTVHVERS